LEETPALRTTGATTAPADLSDAATTGGLASTRLSADAIDVAGVSKTFWRNGVPTHALGSIDLRVRPGEFVCLLGPSGCGKSTLLHIVAGFIAADSGEVTVHGERVTGPGADRCVLFQAPTLFPWLTSRENVLFGPRARRVFTPATRRRADELLDMVGLGEFGDHYPHQLSGGMRHRAALARALINRPPILLMDEPFAALDAITRESMQNFLLDLWQRERMSVLFVTHDVEEAALLSDRVCVMSARPGRITSVEEIALARPRDAALRDEIEFVTLRRGLRERLAGP
jgi:NitT/TauT family transport system ATP-binding protein